MTFHKDIPEEFVVKIQGRDHVTHKGLWWMAHDRFPDRVSSVSELRQAPCKENDQTTIVLCRVSVEHEDGRVQTVTGLGDANPGNVGRMIAPHAPRMAETRAEGRALRKLLNISLTMLEEMDGSGDSFNHPPQTHSSPPQTATRKQIIRITTLATYLANEDEAAGVKKVEEHVGCSLSDLDREKASKIISTLDRKVKEKK